MVEYFLTTFAFLVITALLLYYGAVFHRPSLLDRYVKAQGSPSPKEKSRVDTRILQQMHAYKNMYYKLQNLEKFPEVLHDAKRQLFLLLQEGILMARYKSRPRSIISIQKFDVAALRSFLDSSHRHVLDEFESYIRRRQAGSGPELFTTREEAIQWLKQSAPLNHVDGAWLCHVHKITTPFALRHLTKDLWQTYSEELGDGDLEKNHILIYKNLLRDVGVVLPDCDAVDFIHPRHGLDSEQIWRNAVGHQLISLFPNEFLPEIMGMNLHYESLGPNLLKANGELPEFGISAYYHALHISIDNADSGHSAMAAATVIRFMDHVRETGLMDHDTAWKRVQAGYLLSQSLEDDETVADYEAKLGDMLFQKANVAGKIHCTSRARIGQRSLVDWLSSTQLSTSNNEDGDNGDGDYIWKSGFLLALANSKPWVCKGDSNKSLLMRELSWKGKMFGAFTNAEVERMRVWIDSLSEKNSDPADFYWNLIGDEKVGKTFALSLQDVAAHHPVFPLQREWSRSSLAEFVPQLPLAFSEVRLHALLPLWFVHPCLLENVVSSPYQTLTSLNMQVLRIVRAEMGYMPESDSVMGMDGQLRASYSPDLIDLGLEIVRRHKLCEPSCLKVVLEGDNDATMFAYDLLSWAMRPMQNGSFLLGLARAFLDLEIWVACRDDMLWSKEKEALQRIIDRKAETFELCLLELKGDGTKYRDFISGYEYGREALERLLGAGCTTK
jgi:hypothetical protein